MGLARGCVGSLVLAGAAWACESFREEESGIDATADGGIDAGTADVELDAGPTEDAADAGDASARDFRFVFVTTKAKDGAFATGDAGLEAADAFCANDALGTPLEGLKWRAWLASNVVNPRDRVTADGGFTHTYRLVDEALVFAKDFKLVGGELLPETWIRLDAQGDEVTDARVWTGAAATGLRHPNANTKCSSWTVNASSQNGVAGRTIPPGAGPSATRHWQTDVDITCNTPLHLYCFEVD